MANTTISSLRELYVTNYMSSFRSRVGPIYSRQSSTGATNTACLRDSFYVDSFLPGRTDAFPALDIAEDFKIGDSISAADFLALMRYSANFYGAIRQYVYGVTGNSAPWSAVAVGAIEPGTTNAWRLNNSWFPAHVGTYVTNATGILQYELDSRIPKQGDKITYAVAQTFMQQMGDLAVAATLYSNGDAITVAYPDLRVCHSSCHSNCHTSRGRR